MATVKPVPPGFHTLTPHLVLRNAGEAIEFYKKAFDAEELERMKMPGDNLIMHASLRIGDSMLMLCDEMPMTQHWRAPQSLNGTSVTMHIFVDDADAAFERAVKAGAKVTMPLDDMFWGDRYGKLIDPFGHEWSIATHVKDVTPEEMAEAAKKAFADMGETG